MVVRATIAALGLAIIVLSGSLSTDLTVNRPGAPMGEHISPYRTHGGTTYISNRERWLTNSVPVAVIFLVASLSLAEFLNRRWRRRMVG